VSEIVARVSVAVLGPCPAKRERGSRANHLDGYRVPGNAGCRIL